MIETQSKPARIVVYSDRWDGFGARICCLVNAFSMARALDLDLRIIWPRRDEWGIADPLDFFTQAFWDRHGMTEEELSTRQSLANPYLRTLSAAREFCEAAKGNRAIHMSLIFEVLRFKDEDEGQANDRFRQCFADIGWNETLQDLIDTASQHPLAGKSTAMHLRAGDIMTGRWKQFVPLEKILPYSFVKHAVGKITGPEGNAVTLATDNQHYGEKLKQQFGRIVSPDTFFSNYAALKEGHQAMADVLMMASATRIYGPPQSGFSGLSARLLGTQVRTVNDLMDTQEAMALFREELAADSADRHRTQDERDVFARDVCWYLDVFSDEIPLSEKSRMSARALDADPGFCGALTRKAMHQALSGDPAGAKQTAKKARMEAARVTIQPDPFVESLAVSASVAMLRPDAPSTGLDRLIGRLRKRSEAQAAPPWLFEVQTYVDQIEPLAPFQTAKEPLVENLRYQIAAMSGLTGLPPSRRDALWAAIRAFSDDPTCLSGWRMSGYDRLREPVNFQQVLRNTETISFTIAGATARALSDVPARSGAKGHLGRTEISRTGLAWAYGWAYDPRQPEKPTFVGIVHDGKLVSAGPTWMPRPDVRNVFKDKGIPLNCGFVLPVPMAAASLDGASLHIFRL